MREHIQQVVKFTMTSLILFALHGCAILDTSPDGGFPQNSTKNNAPPTLLPIEAYEFDQEPRL